MNVGDVAAGTCADFLSAFPCALSPLATQRVHFPLVRPPSPPPHLAMTQPDFLEYLAWLSQQRLSQNFPISQTGPW